MKDNERKSMLSKQWIETNDCNECKKPILTAKGEMAAEQFAEANMSIDAGEFSDPDQHYQDFCQCDDIDEAEMTRLAAEDEHRRYSNPF